MTRLNKRSLDELIANTLRSVLMENENGSFNIKNVFHVSSENFDNFKVSDCGYYFFSNKPIRLNGNKHTYICNLSIHKPFIFVLREKNSNTILFLGTVYKPTLWKDDKDNYRYKY